MTEVDLSFVGQPIGPRVFEYTWQDAVLYALGVGAKASDLPFVYEDAPGGLQVVPSFAVVAGGPLLDTLIETVDSSRFLHGEQHMTCLAPLPPEGRVVTTGQVSNIFDKGKGALYHFTARGQTEAGEPLFELRWVIYYAGAGGFGGDPGPKAEVIAPPGGVKPDFSFTDRVGENQAALYRLSGDLNPLHLDPAFARKGGFDRPILHGLCTYGYATRAILHSLCDGQAARLKKFGCRMTSPVFPGETLVTEGWKDGGRYIVQTRTERAVVLGNGYAVVEQA